MVLVALVGWWSGIGSARGLLELVEIISVDGSDSGGGGGSV